MSMMTDDSVKTEFQDNSNSIHKQPHPVALVSANIIGEIHIKNEYDEVSRNEEPSADAVNAAKDRHWLDIFASTPTHVQSDFEHAILAQADSETEHGQNKPDVAGSIDHAVICDHFDENDYNCGENHLESITCDEVIHTRVNPLHDQVVHNPLRNCVTGGQMPAEMPCSADMPQYDGTTMHSSNEESMWHNCKSGNVAPEIQNQDCKVRECCKCDLLLKNIRDLLLHKLDKDLPLACKTTEKSLKRHVNYGQQMQECISYDIKLKAIDSLLLKCMSLMDHSNDIANCTEHKTGKQKRRKRDIGMNSSNYLLHRICINQDHSLPSDSLAEDQPLSQCTRSKKKSPKPSYTRTNKETHTLKCKSNNRHLLKHKRANKGPSRKHSRLVKNGTSLNSKTCNKRSLMSSCVRSENNRKLYNYKRANRYRLSSSSGKSKKPCSATEKKLSNNIGNCKEASAGEPSSNCSSNRQTLAKRPHNIYKEIFQNKRSFVSHTRKHAVESSSDCKASKQKSTSVKGVPTCATGTLCEYTTKSDVKSSPTCTDTIPHKCKICKKVYLRRGCLLKHELAHAHLKPHACATCGKTFSKRGNLTTHERLHTGVKRFACPSCGETFTYRRQLVIHERGHTGEQAHECSVCGRAFDRKDSLMRHLLRHTGERPYTCVTCGRAFRHRSYMREHERLHTGDKPFACTTCDKAFSQRGTLIAHMRVHTGECPYVCVTCGRTFSRSNSLMRHQRVHDKRQIN